MFLLLKVFIQTLPSAKFVIGLKNEVINIITEAMMKRTDYYRISAFCSACTGFGFLFNLNGLGCGIMLIIAVLLLICSEIVRLRAFQEDMAEFLGKILEAQEIIKKEEDK